MNLLRILKTGTWKIPCALLLAGVLALACVQCSVRSLVYLPPQPKDKTAYLEKRAAWEPHRRTFHHNGAKLSGWLIEKKGQPLLVYYGGNAMDISMMLPYLDRFPHAKLLVNYRGYGLSTGSPTEQDIMGDSLAILDSVLKETGRTPDDVILVGQSLGSGVATQVASVRHVKKLVLLVPFDSLLETARGLFPYLPVRLLLPDHFRSDLAAPKVACPVSILAAGADEVRRTTPNGFGTVSPYRSVTRNSPEPCIIPSGSAPALIKRFLKASGTDLRFIPQEPETRGAGSFLHVPAAAMRFLPAALPETGWPIRQ